jgi:hypothetical protein
MVIETDKAPAVARQDLLHGLEATATRPVAKLSQVTSTAELVEPKLRRSKLTHGGLRTEAALHPDSTFIPAIAMCAFPTLFMLCCWHATRN